jgi:hypothetical protein
MTPSPDDIELITRAWRVKVQLLRDVLEDARPIIKHAAVDGSVFASEVLDRINTLLDTP